MNVMHKAIDLRADYEIAALLGRDPIDVMVETQSLAYAGYSHAAEGMFKGTPLQAAYMSEVRYIEEQRAELECNKGSREEWKALSHQQQVAEWEEFHESCAQGIADNLHFYRVMMDMHLVGYVGH